MLEKRDQFPARTDLDVTESAESLDQHLALPLAAPVDHVSPEIALRERAHDQVVLPLGKERPAIEDDARDTGGGRPVDHRRGQVGGVVLDPELLGVGHRSPVVVDAESTRSALLDGFTSANAAASSAASVGGASRTIVGSLRRDAPPALFFIVSAWKTGTTAH